MSVRPQNRPLNSAELHHELRKLRGIDNFTNLGYLAVDYLTLMLILSATICWTICRRWAGWPWAADVPVFLASIVLMGGVQHRLAGLAHEASHFTFLRNRFANDLLADLFCMFPLFATLQQYRMTHMAHHQFTNDWERDPDLADAGLAKGMHRFPMSQRKFFWTYFVKGVLPISMGAYLAKIAWQAVFGGGRNPYLVDRRHGKGQTRAAAPVRWTSLLGLGYTIGLALCLRQQYLWGHSGLLIASAVGAFLAACAVVLVLPSSAFFPCPIKGAYSSRTASLLRLGWMTTLVVSFPLARRITGFDFSPYFWLCWVAPFPTSFGWFMMLRDVYQHANADQGRLTNSRVFFTDPFTRWAIFVHGQDMHIPHHLFPMIPHYNLPRAHRLLQRRSEEYRRNVVECHGTFHNDTADPTILDVLQQDSPATTAGQKVEISRRMAS